MTFLKGYLSFILGSAVFAGGVVLTVVTAGLGAAIMVPALIGGGVLTGVGATAAIQPFAKKMSGERMTGKEYAIDLAIGAGTGLLTGGIGAGGAAVTTNIAAKVGTTMCKQGAIKLMQPLLKAGLVRRVGTRKSGRYILA